MIEVGCACLVLHLSGWRNSNNLWTSHLVRHLEVELLHVHVLDVYLWKKMAAPPEGPARVATGTPVSTSMPTPAAATALTCNTVTPASVRTPPSTMSRPKATMSLFRTPSSRTATPPADEDGGDASQGQESRRRSTQTDDK